MLYRTSRIRTVLSARIGLLVCTLPLLALLLASGPAQADPFYLSATTINEGKVVRNSDKTISTPGEALGDLLAFGITGATLSFSATSPAFQYSFPDGSVYDYSSGTFSVDGAVNGGPVQTLFSGDVVMGRGWTENETGAIANGPQLIHFVSSDLDLQYVNPELHLGPMGLSFSIGQSFRTYIEDGRVKFDTSELRTFTQFSIAIPVPEPSASLLCGPAAALVLLGACRMSRRAPQRG